MAKSQATAPSVNTEELLNMVADLSAQVQTLTEKRAEDEELESGPQNAKTNNAAARVLVAQVGDVVQAEGYVPPIPERVVENGPKAIKKFMKQWREGQGVNARQIGDEAALAETAHM